jgi:hypothetical protein
LDLHVEEGRMIVRPWPIGLESTDPKIARALQEPSYFEFVEVPLEKALRKLAVRHHVKIVLDLPKDVEADITPDTPITLFSDDVEGYLTDTTLRGAFYRLLVPLQLAVELRDGVFCVVEDVGH